MDLPTCPSCHQSVLDDDAVECPFCGASMKGGPSAAKPGAPKAAPKAVAKPPVKVQPQSGVATATKPLPAVNTGKTAKAEQPADDDPFAVDQSANAGAVPVSAKSSPGKTLEVNCPMCETVGYVSPKAAGQMVKCCNPQCMVPVFSAPAPVKKVEAPPPPPPKRPVALYAAGGLIVAAALAGGGYVLFGPDGKPDPKLNEPIHIPPTNAGKTTVADDPAKDAKNIGENSTTEKAAVDPVKARGEFVKQSLQNMVSAALSAPPARKAYCRRLAAGAYLDAGDVAAARDQLDQLQKVGAQTPYEGILPLVSLAWRESATPAELSKIVAEANQLASKLPPRGRLATESAIALSAVLAADGKADAARQLLAKHSAAPAIEQLAALIRVAENEASFTVDAALPGRSLGGRRHPLETAVTLILISHGKSDEALAWATTSPDPGAKTESQLVWSESFARRAAENASDLQRAADAASALTPAGKARLFARLAKVQLDAGHRPQAEELLKQADDTLKSIAPPADVKLPTAKSILDVKLPDPVPLRQAAEAAAEIALVKGELGQSEPAWESARLGMKHLKGLAPSLSFARERVDQLEGPAAEATREELKKILQLKTDDQIRRSFSQYRQKCQDLFKAATARLDAETMVLKTAIGAGALDQVWDELQILDGKSAIEDRQPVLGTALPMVLASRYEGAGNKERKEAILAASQDRLKDANPAEVMEVVTASLVETGQIPGAVQQLNEFSTDAGVLHEWSLRLACRLAVAGKFSQAVELIAGLRDIPLREDGLRLVAALAARADHAEEVKKTTLDKNPPPTEAAAVNAGFVAGLMRGKIASEK